jgi:hypothetical protein
MRQVWLAGSEASAGGHPALLCKAARAMRARHLLYAAYCGEVTAAWVALCPHMYPPSMLWVSARLVEVGLRVCASVLVKAGALFVAGTSCHGLPQRWGGSVARAVL